MGKVLANFNHGFPGGVSRAADNVIESFANKETTASIAFGAPVVLDSTGKGVVNFNPVISSTEPTAAEVLGLAVRTVKTPSSYESSEAEYLPGEMTDVLKRGSISIKLASGNPKPGDRVYWTSAGFTATYTANAVCEITNMRFHTGRDSAYCAEVVLTQRIL